MEPEQEETCENCKFYSVDADMVPCLDCCIPDNHWLPADAEAEKGE